MKLRIDGIEQDKPIPDRFAFAVPHQDEHVSFSDNRNPGLRWEGAPEGTRSFVLICVDSDAPTRPDDVNREDREVPENLPRADFYHWVMVDIPADVDRIAEAACAKDVVPHGRQNPAGPAGARQGLNDYTGWFAGDAAMEGDYYGYDGPCPPWNDARMHHYHFILYATDLERCPVEGRFGGQDVMEALKSHVLAETSVTGTYTLNPRLRG